MVPSKQKLTEFYEAKVKTALTIHDVIGSPFGSLRRIEKNYGEAVCKALLVKLVADVSKFFNYNRNLNQNQGIQTVNLIVECFPDYTIEDFIRCFKNMKTGKYGKFFEGMDGGKIIDCLELYGIDQANEIIELRRQESERHKQEGRELIQNDIILGALKNAVQKLDANKKPVTENKPREKTESEKMFQRWISNFDKIYQRQNPFGQGLKFVKRSGKMMDINEFLEHKIEQFNNYKTKQNAENRKA